MKNDLIVPAENPTEPSVFIEPTLSPQEDALITTWESFQAFLLSVIGRVAIVIGFMIQKVADWRQRRQQRKAHIDINAKCPGCGNRAGEIRMALVFVDSGQPHSPHIKHTCKICTTEWYEPTVLDPQKWYRPPTSARQDVRR